MCGLVAFLRSAPGDAVADLASVSAARDRMRARGPDGAGIWQDPGGRVTLGHRRLAIRDLAETGAQPMVDPVTGSVLVFNGELYDLEHLRADLGEGVHDLRGTSDTEVLLHRYRKRGPGAFEGLRGMYAAVLWDAPRQRLVLARDPYGIKPLYLAATTSGTWVASQVRTLAGVAGVDTSPEPAGHVGFFSLGYVPEPWTIYRGIASVPAGACWEIADDGRPRPIAQIDVLDVLRGTASERGDAQGVDVAKAVCSSVASHLVADVPVGLFLSAGIDSAVVAACASRAKSDVRTFTMGFDVYRGTADDEVPGAQATADALHTQHACTWLARPDVVDAMDQLFADMDQPTFDGVNTWFVSRAAAASGLKVALSGLGGDELLGGYSSFKVVPRGARSLGWVSRRRWLARAARTVISPAAGRVCSPKWAAVPELAGTWWGAYLLRRGMFMPHELGDVLDPQVAREGWDRLDLPGRFAATIEGMPTDHARVLALESTWYMRSQLLRDSDWAGMAHGLEIRVPLVDVALLGQLAPLLVATPPPTKGVLRQVGRGMLPDEVFTRPKTGFQVPLRRWMEADRSTVEPGSPRLRHGFRGWSRRVHRAVAAEHADVLAQS